MTPFAHKMGFDPTRLQRPGNHPIGYDPSGPVMLEEIADGTLLLRIASGSESDLGVLYDRFERPVYSLAYRMLGDGMEAEDVVQDVFVKIWNKALEYRSERASLSTWVLSITHHTAIDHLRRRQARATVDVEAAVLEAHPDPRSSTESLLDAVGIQRALERLEPQERSLVELAYYDGLTHQQLAARTGLPLGTIKTRLRSSLGKLRHELHAWT